MIVFFILLEIAVFCGGMYLLNKYDKELGIEINWKEYAVIGVILSITEILLFSFYGYGREFGCHSLILFYLIVASYIDYRTKRVYRIGSLFFILLSMMMFASSGNFSTAAGAERIFSILIFSLIVIIQGSKKMMGWGDVLTYIGVFFWLASWEKEYLVIELFAVYMMVANILFLIFNIPKFDWKTRSMKEETAFLPGMTGAAIILELSRMWM